MHRETVLAGVARAKSAIQDLAIPATLVTRGAAVQVPGSTPTYPETTSAIKIVLSGYTAKEIDGERVRASDLAGLIFPETGHPVPQPNDRVVVDSVSYRIIQNNKVMAGNEVALSQVQLRM